MSKSPSSQESLEDLARRLETQAHHAIWSGTDWLDAAAIAARGGQPLDAAQQKLSAWEGERRLFALQKDGIRFYPRYAFAGDDTPLPVIADVMAVLPRHSQAWFASWFESTSAFLGGARPRELVRMKPELVVAAAKDAWEAEEYCG